MTVQLDRKSLDIPTYPIPEPDQHPMFFEKRVYQGSSGKVYPLAFYSRISDEKVNQAWDIWQLENDYVQVQLMPELGGRIWHGLDKTNQYDFFYRQRSVKPALVGLAGPWISGGVEFNWPQHHRPATYLPTDVTSEENEDGSKTVWMSDHDPMCHMKGMHGITIRPGSSVVELSARLYNRTAYKQTFLWWANVAAEVHDQYQSFFPPDVQYVADHAVRAMSSFPVAKNHYYGVDYRPGTDLSWYKNIPVPTSYMITQSNFNFFGGFDYSKDGGFVHVANRYVCPGKKQWTWGNHPFGWAWDRELTDPDENGQYPPYIELMAGTYTDNQPDFSYLLPYETKTFKQYWWPIRGIGVVHQASQNFALHLSLDGEQSGQQVAKIGLCASSKHSDTRLRLTAKGQLLHDEPAPIAPDQPVLVNVPIPNQCPEHDLVLQVIQGGVTKLQYAPPQLDPKAAIPASATEPPAAEEIKSNDELYLTGEHLEQYRHPTRNPEDYWLKAIERDPGDQRANTAMGRKLLDRGLIKQATDYLQTAVNRSRIRHPNPEDGQALYFLGLACKRLGQTDQAYQWLYKSTWNYAWRSSAYYQLATIDSSRGDFDQAIEHLNLALETNTQNNHASNLKAALLRRTGQIVEAQKINTKTLAQDKLDYWASYEQVLCRHNQEQGQKQCDEQVIQTWSNSLQLRPGIALDVAFDYAESGLIKEAIYLLNSLAQPTVMVHYTLAWLYYALQATENCAEQANDHLTQAQKIDQRWVFPDRYEEQVVLEHALKQNSQDATASLALGNLLYDKRRYQEAIKVWQEAAQSGSDHPAIYRNLGIAQFNVEKDHQAAESSYAKAYELDSANAQVLFEYDLLQKCLGKSPEQRLARLEDHKKQVQERDDLSIEYVTLLNLTGQYQQSAEYLKQRSFHPWEGGEGKVLTQYTATYLYLGKQALDKDPQHALECFNQAMDVPTHLGEDRHLLANTAEINYNLGLAHQALGQIDQAQTQFKLAAENEGDFLDMGVHAYSEKSYYKGLALQQLNQPNQAQQVFNGMIKHGKQLCEQQAKIDYFATSLPDLLVFQVDPNQNQQAQGKLLQALGKLGLAQTQDGFDLIDQVLVIQPSHQTARELKAQAIPTQT